jgi:hypothetical protein
MFVTHRLIHRAIAKINDEAWVILVPISQQLITVKVREDDFARLWLFREQLAAVIAIESKAVVSGPAVPRNTVLDVDWPSAQRKQQRRC